MLTKDKIFEILEHENLPKEEFIIISGAAMVIYGIKDKTSDIDIATSKTLYDNLRLRKDCVIEKVLEDTKEVIYYLHELNFGMNYYDTKYQYINGYKVQTIEEIIKIKENLNRDKDKKDLENIKKFISKKES